MEDTTNNAIDGPEPARESGVRDFLISSDEQWEQAPRPKFIDACDSLRRYGVFLNTGDTASHPVPCNSWDHQPCAEKHAIEELRIFDGLISGSEVVFYARVRIDEFRSARLSDRRGRLAKKAGRVWYRWCERADGWVWMIASHPLGGRDAPQVFTPADKPLKIAAVALRQPGVRKVDGSSVKNARAELLRDSGVEASEQAEDDSDDTGVDDTDRATAEDEPDASPKVKWIGTATHSQWEEMEQRAAVYAKDRFGVEVNPSYPVVVGSGFTVEQWAECLAYAKSTM
jgi:hypothetical protein